MRRTRTVPLALRPDEAELLFLMSFSANTASRPKEEAVLRKIATYVSRSSRSSSAA